MLLKAEGWVAYYKSNVEGKEIRDPQRVVFWQERGDGDVVGLVSTAGREGRPPFVPANRFENFVGYGQDRVAAAVTLLPCPAGWWAVFRTGTPPFMGLWEPIIAWQVVEGWDSVEALSAPGENGISLPHQSSESCRFIFAPHRAESGEGPWPPQRAEGGHAAAEATPGSRQQRLRSAAPG